MSDDLRFDQLLREDATALPPSLAVVNPWREAMALVLWGMGLTTITFNFLYLNMILPALGGILMVLGFRTLRQENNALRWCWRLSIVMAVARSISFVLAALPVDTGNTIAYLMAALIIVLSLCLWRGMVGVSRAAGAEKPAAPAAGALVIYYVVMCVLAFISLEGWLAVLPVLIVYVVILRNLMKLSRSLSDTGYVIHAASVRLPSAAVLWGYLGLTLAAVLLAMFLGQRYPMNWQARDDASQDETVRAELLDLGFPEKVLDDLTAEEVARMSGAVKVHTREEPLYGEDYRIVTTDKEVDEDTHPGWRPNGRYKRSDGQMCYRYRVYGGTRSVMTHVVVELPEQYGEKQCILIHYLDYTLLSGPRYSEMMEIWKAEQMLEDWRSGSICSGRLLCDRDGQPLTADFYELTGATNETEDFFGTTFVQSTITAQWTLPIRADNVRLYVMYDAFLQEGGHRVLMDIVNYLRQTAPIYPLDGMNVSLWELRSSSDVERYQPSIHIDL